MSTRLLIAPLLFLPTLALAKYEVNWSICDAGTQCKQCVERGAFSIERIEAKVIVSGMSVLGEPVTGELEQCNFKAADAWACDSGRLRFVNDSGRVKVSYTGRPIELNGKRLEFCSVQTK
ncbi:MAG: hypothetical protein ACO3E7_07515 [Burkholderiaceae bacterium]